MCKRTDKCKKLSPNYYQFMYLMLKNKKLFRKAHLCRLFIGARLSCVELDRFEERFDHTSH